MEIYVLKTKNFTISSLGKFVCEETGECCNHYIVNVKGIDCSEILFQFDGDQLECSIAWEQDNEIPEGLELKDFTDKIAKLIENDVVEIVRFMNKHLL